MDVIKTRKEEREKRIIQRAKTKHESKWSNLYAWNSSSDEGVKNSWGKGYVIKTTKEESEKRIFQKSKTKHESMWRNIYTWSHSSTLQRQVYAKTIITGRGMRRGGCSLHDWPVIVHAPLAGPEIRFLDQSCSGRRNECEGVWECGRWMRGLSSYCCSCCLFRKYALCSGFNLLLGKVCVCVCWCFCGRWFSYVCVCVRASVCVWERET